MKFYADKLILERTLKVGDQVYLKLQPYCQSSINVRHNVKITAKYHGPYTVLQKVGPVAHHLDLPSGSQIHPLFHVSQLKRHVGPTIQPQVQPPRCDSNGRQLMQPLSILQRKMVKVNNGVGVQFLIHWADLGVDEATWEDWSYIKNQFPEFVAQQGL